MARLPTTSLPEPVTALLGITDANRKWWILAATGGSLGLVLLDEALFLALPTIRDELDLSEVLTQWIVNAYVLALTVTVAAAGRLGDILGHRPVFIAGATTLGAGSVVVGIAQDTELLIAGRAIQGFGTAGILSLGVSMTGIAFAERERGVALGLYGLIGAAAAACAPFLGGLLTDEASWRWIPFLNVPIALGLITIVAAAWREPERDSSRAAFDRPGFALLLAVLLPLVVALMQTPVWGWGSPAVITLLAVSAAALVGFVWVEGRARSPLIDLAMARRPVVVGANTVVACAQLSVLTVLVFGALYLQDRLEMSALLAGTALLAAVVPSLFTSVLAGQLTDRYGARTPALAGTAASFLALAWIAAFVPSDNFVLLLPGFLLWGLALSFLFTPSQTTIMNAVAPQKRGEMAGIQATGRQLGGTLAVAVLGSVLVTTDSFGAVFAIAAGITLAVWVTAFLTFERAPRPRPARLDGASSS